MYFPSSPFDGLAAEICLARLSLKQVDSILSIKLI